MHTSHEVNFSTDIEGLEEANLGRYIAYRDGHHRLGVNGAQSARQASRTIWHELARARQVEQLGGEMAFRRRWMSSKQPGLPVSSFETELSRRGALTGCRSKRRPRSSRDAATDGPLSQFPASPVHLERSGQDAGASNVADRLRLGRTVLLTAEEVATLRAALPAEWQKPPDYVALEPGEGIEPTTARRPLSYAGPRKSSFGPSCPPNTTRTLA